MLKTVTQCDYHALEVTR